MGAYTDGPWKIGFEDGTGLLDDEDGAWIVGRDDEIVVVGGSHDGLKHGVTDEDNAILIASAPALLEACKRAYAFLLILAEKKAADTGASVEDCLEPEALLLRDVLSRAERKPQKDVH